MQTRWNDADLLSALRGGEAERNRALQYLTQHSGWLQQVRRHVAANSGTDEDGEEVFFDALVVLDRNVREGRFEGNSSLNTYFIGIVKNKWHKALAKRRPVLDSEKLYPSETQYEHAVERTIISEEHITAFRQIMTQISDRCNRIFELFHLGHSMAEIAQMVGISNADQAKKEKNRCKNRLLALLAQRPELRNFFNER